MILCLDGDCVRVTYIYVYTNSPFQMVYIELMVALPMLRYLKTLFTSYISHTSFCTLLYLQNVPCAESCVR